MAPVTCSSVKIFVDPIFTLFAHVELASEKKNADLVFF
jgi:hypothetical protein